MNPGDQLGPYEIKEPLGAGGMGEVYLAEDERLGRRVAIKVLPDRFASDPARLARFEQEARAAAALNHPHIAAVFDVGSAPAAGATVETRYIVQEYLEGETLRWALAAGRLPLKKTLALGIEIAEALAAAHAAAIVHRDLKPDNVFVTCDGHVKVLDFGLAKLTEVAPAATESASPTVIGTVAGQMMGTAGYMAPEQARGDEKIDGRADLFAFGCLFYEMATGGRAFGGESALDILHAIVHSDPASLAQVDMSLPAELDRIVAKSLAKDPADRYQTAADLVVDLRALAARVEAGTAPSLRVVTAAGDGPQARRGLPVAATVVVASVALLAGAVGSRLLLRSGPLPMKRFEITLPADHHFPSGVGSLAAISPDGQHLVYVAVSGGLRRLYHRAFDAEESVALAGTEGAAHPFFSPDSRWVGFSASGDLHKVALAGGVPQRLARFGSGTGYGAWRDDQVIVFSRGNAGIWSVPAGGGEEPRRLVEVDETQAPQGYERLEPLPGGEVVVAEADRGLSANNAIVLVSLLTGEVEVIAEPGTDPVYLPSGHVVFARPGELWAVPVDVGGRRASGEAARILGDVRVETGGAAHFAAADDGTFLYVPGRAGTASLVWADRAGNKAEILSGRQPLARPRLSPDGRRIAYESASSAAGGSGEIWIHNLELGTVRRLTSGGNDRLLAWEPAGEGIYFASLGRQAQPTLYRALADFSAREFETIYSVDGYNMRAGDVSASGRLVVLHVESGADGALLSIERGGSGEATTVLDTRYDELSPALSPNGQWIAYVSNESGRDEIIVASFPELGASEQVSAGGGTQPVWSDDGGELFYRSGDDLMAARIELDPTFRVLGTTRLFPFGNSDDRWSPNYDYDTASQRFVVIERDVAESIRFNVILNYFEELQRLAPAGRTP
ncbi:MAG TPA: protein kinase [Acidobacteriota bacterium]